MLKTSTRIRLLTKVAETPAGAEAPAIDWGNSSYKQRIAFRKQHGRSKAYRKGMNKWWKSHVSRKSAKAAPVAKSSPTMSPLAKALKKRTSKPGMTPSHGMVRDEAVAPFRKQITVAKAGTKLGPGVRVGKPKASILGQEGVRAAPMLFNARPRPTFRPLASETPEEHVSRRKKEQSASSLVSAQGAKARMEYKLKDKTLKPNARTFLQGNLNRASKDVALYSPTKASAPTGAPNREKALALLKKYNIKGSLKQTAGGGWVRNNDLPKPPSGIATR
jgi:hypothetical protein